MTKREIVLGYRKEISEEEYAPIREERRAWRAEINSLEEKIAELKKPQ